MFSPAAVPPTTLRPAAAHIHIPRTTHHSLQTLMHHHHLQIRFMGHLWEPLRCFYKPLAFYAATEALTLMSWAMLVWGYGFEMGSLPCGYVYFTLNMPKRVKQQQQHSSSSAAGSSATTAAAATAAATPLPMVFLHGVGLGVLPYMLFIGSLAAEMSLPSTASATASAPAPQRQPLLLLDHAHVSLRLLWSLFSTRKRPAAAATATPGAAAEAVSRAEAAAHLPTVCGVASRVLQLLDMHGFQQAMLVGHSYGTLVVSRLLKPGFKDAAGRESRSRVAACALIDPGAPQAACCLSHVYFLNYHGAFNLKIPG